MRILIAPLGMPLPTRGPAGRAIRLAAEAVRRGHETIVCSALDDNLDPRALPPEVTWIETPAPVPLGLPRLIGRPLPKLAAAAGLGRRAKVDSFEQVLFIGGHLKSTYFQKDVAALRRAIRRFRPDLVFSEYRLQAIVAARLEGLFPAGVHSRPGRAAYAASPRLSRSVRGWLEAQGFERLESILSLYEQLSPRFVASSPALEPFEEEVVYVGPLTASTRTAGDDGGGRIVRGQSLVAYLGGGSLPLRQATKVLARTAGESRRPVYLAGGKTSRSSGDLHIAPRFDFSELLPRAAIFLNHGGQNSIMDGLLAGVPQIMIPGRVFERRYNADSVKRLGAGLILEPADFTPRVVARSIEQLTQSDAADRADRAGRDLAALGGATRVFDVLENLAAGQTGSGAG